MYTAKSFFHHHHRLELITLIFSLIVLITSTYLGYYIFLNSQNAGQLIKKGDESLRSEDFDEARQNFVQAQKLTTLPILGIKLNSSIDERVKLASVLQTSHNHFITGINLYNRHLYDQALVEFQQISGQDSAKQFVDSLITEVQELSTKEKAAIKDFEDLYTKSLEALKKKDNSSFLALSRQALNYSSSEFNIDKKKAEELRGKRSEVAQQVEQERAAKPKPEASFQLRIPILMYHYIRHNPVPTDQVGFSLSVTPEDFEEQMKYLSTNGYKTTDVKSVMEAIKNKQQLDPKTIVLTFDDGYKDLYFEALPVLKKYNLHAESYVVTGFVGGTDYLTWDMILEMSKSGLVTFGSHTVHHAYLPSLSTSKMAQELTESKKDLESHLGIPISDFCFPYGAFSTAAVKEVEKAGYSNATTTIGGYWHAQDSVYKLTRVRVSGGQSLQSFIKRL